MTCVTELEQSSSRFGPFYQRISQENCTKSLPELQKPSLCHSSEPEWSRTAHISDYGPISREQVYEKKQRKIATCIYTLLKYYCEDPMSVAVPLVLGRDNSLWSGWFIRLGQNRLQGDPSLSMSEARTSE